MQPALIEKVVAGSDGSVTVPALSLTGTYTVTVSKDGFGTEERKDIALRSGETATLKVTLLVGGSQAEVTVFGTTEGVRSNPQIGVPLKDTANQRDAHTRPQSQHIATSQLSVSSGERHWRSLRQFYVLHHRRRLATRDDLHT